MSRVREIPSSELAPPAAAIYERFASSYGPFRNQVAVFAHVPSAVIHLMSLLMELKAQGNVGRMYLEGEGVTNDLVQAYFWFKLASEHGEAFGRHFVEDFDDNERLTPDQVAEAEKMVRTFHQTHSSKRAVSQPAADTQSSVSRNNSDGKPSGAE